jgi:prepilin-type N-terminal cleavage/methylation domain-containing protein
MAHCRTHSSIRPAQGFTLIELIVSMIILVAVLVGVLALFDANNKVSRVQTNLADLQQSQRIAQHELIRNVRMAARGGLPTRLAAGGIFAGRLLPGGMAIEVRNNVAANPNLVPGDTATPLVVPGTDVVTVRGIFESPVYAVNPAAGLLTLTTSGTTETGSIVISNVTTTGVKQSLQPLVDLVTELDAAGEKEALLLISPLDDVIFGIVELNPTSTLSSVVTVGGEVTQITADFNITDGTYTSAYQNLSPGGGFPATMQSVAFLGVLQEYKYYIRQISDGGAAGLNARLSRAQFYPGTNVAHATNPLNLRADIAENIVDLQVALGIDVYGAAGPGSAPDESIMEGTAADATPTAADEWLFNHAGDTDTNGNLVLATWNDNTKNLEPHLYYMRISTLARTDRRDPTYISPAIQSIEDHDYSETATPTQAELQRDRRYRRRLLQTVVDLRNIS